MNNQKGDIMENKLVAIIEACGKNGVNYIKMGAKTTEIAFNGFVIKTKTDYPIQSDKPLEIADTDPNFQHQMDFEMEQQETEDLMLTDPVAWEEAQTMDMFEDSQTHEDPDGE